MIGFVNLLRTRREQLISSRLRSTPNSSLMKFIARISVSSRLSAFTTLITGTAYVYPYVSSAGILLKDV